ncbi:MAG: branched-chain amino acid aminotransferase [Candidatus Cyclobacteriaceae bacterium M2_1C_046]
MTDTLDIKINKTADTKLSDIDFNNIQFGQIYSDHEFIADYKNGEWQNFRITPYEDLKISPASPAIHYGQSIFEGLKAYKNEKGELLIFRPDQNFERLNISARRMVLPELPEEVFMEGLKTLLDLDRSWVPNKPNTSLYIRPFIFSADEYIGIRPSKSFKFMIITCPVGAYYSKPVKVKIETEFTRAVKGGTGYAKAAGNYAGALYPAKLAQDKGYDQLIWTDGIEHKYIEESGTMNIMFVIDGKLVTPAVSDSILSGITRDSVLTIARDWGMEVEERKVSVEEIIKALEEGKLTEAFGAGTAATIAPIELIGYKGKDYKLPPVEEREFANKVLAELDAIRTGKKEDPYGWVMKI